MTARVDDTTKESTESPPLGDPTDGPHRIDGCDLPHTALARSKHLLQALRDRDASKSHLLLGQDAGATPEQWLRYEYPSLELLNDLVAADPEIAECAKNFQLPDDLANYAPSSLRRWPRDYRAWEVEEFPGLGYCAPSIALNFDRNLAVVSAKDGDLHAAFLLNLVTKTCRRIELGSALTPIRAVAISPDGLTVAVAQGDFIRLIDNAGKVLTLCEDRGSGDVTAIAFSPDGATLASGAELGTILLWNVKQNTYIQVQAKGLSKGVIRALAFRPHDHLLASTSYDNNIYLWDITTVARSGSDATHYTVPSDLQKVAVSFSADGSRLASVSRNGAIALWDVATRTSIGEPFGSDSRPWKSEVGGPAVFSPDGVVLASCTDTGVVILWDVATRQRIAEIPTAQSGAAISALGFTADGGTILVGGPNHPFRMIRFRTTTAPRARHSSENFTTGGPAERGAHQAVVDASKALVSAGPAERESAIAELQKAINVLSSPESKATLAALAVDQIQRADVLKRPLFGQPGKKPVWLLREADGEALPPLDQGQTLVLQRIRQLASELMTIHPDYSDDYKGAVEWVATNETPTDLDKDLRGRVLIEALLQGPDVVAQESMKQVEAILADRMELRSQAKDYKLETEKACLKEALATLVKRNELAGGSYAGKLTTLLIEKLIDSAARSRKGERSDRSDRRTISAAVLQAAIDDFLAKKGPEPQGAASVATSAQARSAHRQNVAESAVCEPDFDDSERKIMDAQTKADLEFKSKFKHPNEQARQAASPTSEYMRRIAELANVTPAVALEQLERVKVTMTRLVLIETVRQRFKYHCPYCDKTESPTCAYKNELVEWKFQHSLKKPWNETTVE